MTDFFQGIHPPRHRAALPIFVGQTTESDHWNFRCVAIVFQTGQPFKSADFGHQQVEQDEIRFLLFGAAQRCSPSSALITS